MIVNNPGFKMTLGRLLIDERTFGAVMLLVMCLLRTQLLIVKQAVIDNIMHLARLYNDSHDVITMIKQLMWETKWKAF